LADPQLSDYQKWLHELKRSDAERAHDKIDEFHRYANEAAVRTADLALRMAMLINGGAAIAVLAFIGGLISKDKIAAGQLANMATSLAWFACGVVIPVAGMALSYLTNYCMAAVASSQRKNWEHPYVEPGPRTAFWRRFNLVFHVFAFGAGLASLILFVVGMLSVKTAITHLL
jgi:hypothetical protein